MGDILLEDGSGGLETEDGAGAIELEGAESGSGGGILLEDGSATLLEDRSDLLLEGGSSQQTFRQALTAKLESVSELTAIVGTAIYPGAIPEDHDLGRDGPALTYTIPGSPRGHHLGGADGTSLARVKIDVWGYTFSEVDAATLAWWNAIDGLPGQWGDGSCVIMSISHQDEQDLHQPPKAGSDQWTYHIQSEYAVKFRTGLPTLS